MRNNEREQNPANIKKTLWILWSALVFSMLVHAGLGLFIPNQPGFTPSGEYRLLLVPLIIVALLQTSFIVAFWSKLLKPTHGELSAFFTPFVIRMALSESIGLYGLFLSFLGAPREYLFVFIGWGILLQLTLAPTENTLQHFKKTYGKS